MLQFWKLLILLIPSLKEANFPELKGLASSYVKYIPFPSTFQGKLPTKQYNVQRWQLMILRWRFPASPFYGTFDNNILAASNQVNHSSEHFHTYWEICFLKIKFVL